MKRPLIIHMFLFSIWPVLFIFVGNIDYIGMKYLLMPILLVLFLALICLLIVNIFIKNIHISALIVSPVIVSSLCLGLIYHYIYASFEKSSYFVIPIISLLGIGVYVFYCVKLLKLSSGYVTKITEAMNIVAIVLCVINISQIFIYNFNNKLIANDQNSFFKYRFSGTPPDIYYIILDEYAGLDQIKTYYNYDNTNFAIRLTKKGFFVARESKVKEANTAPSLMASLNMGFTTEKNKSSSYSSIFSSISSYMNLSENSQVKELLQNNKVAEILVAHNYKYYHIGSWFYGTRYNKYAEHNINYFGFHIDNPLIIELCNSSIIRFLFARNLSFISEYFQRESVLDAFASLSKVAAADGPKFVFAHIVSPHEPFIFGPEGQSVPLKKRGDWRDKSLYLGQYIFITKKAEEVINSILEKSKTPPIIIVQSDHGVRFDKPSANKIFNAYYLPDDGNNLLYNSISPVNTFRLIFNYYFGTKYDLLNDAVTAQQ